MPVFLFAFSLSDNPHISKLILVFICLHFFLYPASNGFNSYFDKDEESIGGLRNPPPVDRNLYYTSLLFDMVALLIASFVSLFFFVTIFLYGIASKAYSHPSVRLKKSPFAGWLVTGLFQGFVIFIATYQGVNETPVRDLISPDILFPAALSSILLWGSYPMTQVYQHDEDAKRGDITLSLKLGIKGTFYFTGAVFQIAVVGFIYYFVTYYSLTHALLFLFFLLPVLAYFLVWFFKVNRNPAKANFQNTMNLNTISSLCLNSFFILFTFL